MKEHCEMCVVTTLSTLSQSCLMSEDPEAKMSGWFVFKKEKELVCFQAYLWFNHGKNWCIEEMPFELDAELRAPFYIQLRVRREREAVNRRNANRRQSEKQTVNGEQNLRHGELPNREMDEKANAVLVSMTKHETIILFHPRVGNISPPPPPSRDLQLVVAQFFLVTPPIGWGGLGVVTGWFHHHAFFNFCILTFFTILVYLLIP